ncbi:MAG: cytochrome C oxidase subunit IV family protein [Gemmatimonadales bacterium]
MESAHEPAMKLYVMIWIGLLLIVGVEVALTYAGLSTGTLLAALLSLASVEAGLGVMYFMHLRYERRILFWSLIPGLIFVLLMLNHLWRDAARMISLHL